MTSLVSSSSARTVLAMSALGLFASACSSSPNEPWGGAADAGTYDSPPDHRVDPPETGASDSRIARDAKPTPDAQTPPLDAGSVTFTDTVAMFHLNVQEYGHWDDSVETITRVLDLFDQKGLRLDVYLTTWMVDRLEGEKPDLLARILTSPNVSVSYHTRPPAPYRANFVDKRSGHDWYGLWNMTTTAQYDVILNYERHGLDLKTGQPTASEGGFAKLTRLYGRAPYVAGDETEAYMTAAVDKVFKDLGTTFVINHGRPSSEGDARNGIPVKPEWVDVKAFNTDSSLDGDTCITKATGGEIYDCEIARCGSSTKKPCTVAFKMHDNDFFADASWWLTVYSTPTPPWDPSKLAAKLTPDAKAAMWARYEQIVSRAAENRSKVSVVGAKDWASRIQK